MKRGGGGGREGQDFPPFKVLLGSILELKV